MDRRNFLLKAGQAAALTMAAEPAFAEILPNLHPYFPKSNPPGLSILQGYTTETETQLSVVLDSFENVVYTLKDLATNRSVEPDSVREARYRFHPERVDKLKFSGLQLGRRYNLTVFSRKLNKQIDSRFLSTVDLNKPNPRIGLMSCMKDFFVLEETKISMWESARAANLDYIFFLGDTVYGDVLMVNGPNFLWERYVESRNSIPFYRWQNLKPVLATWDDHDFGKNDADGTYAYKAESLSHFQTFFAQESDKRHLFKGYGNSLLFRAFGQNFAFFDNRYFRGGFSEKSRAFLGKTQIDWMFKGISQNHAPTVIMNGAPTFGRFEKGSSYQQIAPEELHYFLAKLRSANVPAILAGGDLHYSETSKLDRSLLGYNSFEIVVGCMHSNTKTKYYANPNPHMFGTLNENFIMFERPGNVPVWQTTCVTTNKRIAYKTRIQIG